MTVHRQPLTKKALSQVGELCLLLVGELCLLLVSELCLLLVTGLMPQVETPVFDLRLETCDSARGKP